MSDWGDMLSSMCAWLCTWASRNGFDEKCSFSACQRPERLDNPCLAQHSLILIIGFPSPFVNVFLFPTLGIGARGNVHLPVAPTLLLVLASGYILFYLEGKGALDIAKYSFNSKVNSLIKDDFQMYPLALYFSNTHNFFTNLNFSKWFSIQHSDWTDLSTHVKINIFCQNSSIVCWSLYALPTYTITMFSLFFQ